MGGVVGVALVLILLAAGSAGAARPYLAVGSGGRPWSAVAELSVALDDTTVAPAIQPKEFKAWENIVAGPVAQANLFGFPWYRGKIGMEALGLTLGLNPRIWSANNNRTPPEVFDGNPLTYTALVQLVPRLEYSQYATSTSSGGETGIAIVDQEVHTLDLAIALPVNRVRFYPPQQGLDRRGVPNRNTSPQGLQISVCRYALDYLLLGAEVYPFHALDHIVERTLANSRSVVDVVFPVEFVRFVRIDLSLMPQAYSLAEIELYGQGVAPQATFTSRALDLGQPVNYGAIGYSFRKFRLAVDGTVREDPEAPVRLVLQTKTGHDGTPLAYHVVDELGRDVEVTKAAYESASLPNLSRPSLRLPGMRGLVTEEEENWTPWSSPYGEPGEQNRSADGRRYLQFRFSLETDDPLAFGRLDSLRFQYSPLLVRDVVGEVSREDAPGAAICEMPAGVEQVLAYDLRARFDASSQLGYDGIRLDTPPATRLLAMEMGEPLAPVEPDSVRYSQGQVVVYFPSHRITALANQPVRLLLATTVLNVSTFFTGDVFDTQSDNLPQSIQLGDAQPGVAANTLQVYAVPPRLAILADVAVMPRILTPNGDGANDEVEISFTVMAVEQAQLEVEIRDLTGQRVRMVQTAGIGQGRGRCTWDGTDDAGRPVWPGLYLCRVALDTQSGTKEATRLVAVAY
jgi:hypothetical protein